MRLFDYRDLRGINRIAAWTRELQPEDRAKLWAKLLILEKLPVDQLPGYLKGPIQREKEIYKLQIGASGSRVALRPMVCRGPGEKNTEITLLVGAEERGGKLPKGIGATAEKYRQHILQDSTRRCPHEWVS
jgi:hypothetical protein